MTRGPISVITGWFGLPASTGTVEIHATYWGSSGVGGGGAGSPGSSGQPVRNSIRQPTKTNTEGRVMLFCTPGVTRHTNRKARQGRRQTIHDGRSLGVTSGSMAGTAGSTYALASLCRVAFELFEQLAESPAAHRETRAVAEADFAVTADQGSHLEDGRSSYRERG